MGALSIRELNSNISKALSRVEAGETLDITRNGKIIAELRQKRPVKDAEWWAAYRESVDVLTKGFPVNVGTIDEDDKYGDAPL